MNTQGRVLTLKEYIRGINFKLLLFLLLFLNVKLVIKIAAILVIYMLQPNFKFGFTRKSARLPLFYIAVCLIALANLIIYKYVASLNYDIAFLVGIAHWLLCLLAIHQVKMMVDNTDTSAVYRTLIVFFVINTLASFGEIVHIILETGALNPYRYQGQFQKYFISTGDYIKGITFDTSTTNAVLNSFGIVLFLYKRNIPMVLLCTTTLLLTASNLVNIVLFLTLLILFVFKTDKNQKSILVVCCLLTAIFFGKASPQNGRYVLETFERITHTKIVSASRLVANTPVTDIPNDNLTLEEQKEKTALVYLDSMREKKHEAYQNAQKLNNPIIEAVLDAGSKPEIPQPNIHTAPFQHRDDTPAVRNELLQFAATYQESKTGLINADGPTARPGKVLAFKQTFQFFQQHPQKLLTGNGIGTFSSKLALRTTALHFAGGYPGKFRFIHPDFYANHLALYLQFFSKNAREHSVTNSPNSVYDQLVSEYGVLGLAAFLCLYVGYFLRHYRKLTYGLPMLVLLLGFFFMEYWFEQLSIVILFELLLFLDIKEASTKQVS